MFNQLLKRYINGKIDTHNSGLKAVESSCCTPVCCWSVWCFPKNIRSLRARVEVMVLNWRVQRKSKTKQFIVDFDSLEKSISAQIKFYLIQKMRASYNNYYRRILILIRKFFYCSLKMFIVAASLFWEGKY